MIPQSLHRFRLLITGSFAPTKIGFGLVVVFVERLVVVDGIVAKCHVLRESRAGKPANCVKFGASHVKFHHSQRTTLSGIVLSVLVSDLFLRAQDEKCHPHFSHMSWREKT
eukprot:g2281.t1